MATVSVNILKEHPQNSFFFDDISGDAWDAFLDSVRTSGIIEPIVVTQDNIIVSGHQRVRACKELGINDVKYVVNTYASEDQITKDLIETNLRQRGIGNPNPVKLGRCIKELERIYGIRQGRRTDIVKKVDNVNIPTTETEFAEKLGMSRQTLQNYKKLAELIPEVEDFLVTGMITPTTALAISHQLCVDDQKVLMSKLDEETKYTQSEVQKQIDAMKLNDTDKPTQREKFEKTRADKYKSENDDLKKKLENSYSSEDYNSVKAENEKLRAEIEELKKEEKPPFPISEEPSSDNNVSSNAIDVISSSEYQELLEKYNDLISQHNTDQDLIANKDADINRLQLSMDDNKYHAAKSNKILAALSRVNSVVQNELLPLLYNNDLSNVSDAMSAKVEESLLNNIEIMNKCIMDLHTGNYKEVNVEEISVIE